MRPAGKVALVTGGGSGIGPGVIDTPLGKPLLEEIKAAGRDVAPLGRVGEPKDGADLALFLASDEADYLTGDLIFVDGGPAVGQRWR